jgi:AraC-like DNA-binding protein
MSYLLENIEQHGTEIKAVVKNKNGAVFEVVGKEGRGRITCYPVFPGIELMFNDFSMGECFESISDYKNVMEINHCSQGRFETELNDGSFIYLKAGDLSVNMLGIRTKGAYFPLDRYKGVSVVIDLNIASCLSNLLMADMDVDLFSLRDKLCHEVPCFILRSIPEIDHIFAELYTVPEVIREGYFKLKVMELLLFLKMIEPHQSRQQLQYFNREQVNRVKQIKKFLLVNIDQTFTLTELSEQFNISLTTMKNCFKGVYGTTICSFVRAYRMQIAAQMLLTGKESITEIAGCVGYNNASKFAAVFKKEMGVTPMHYRKNCLIGAKRNSLE